MSDTPYIIEMNHITKRFPGIVANDDVTLQIRKGEIYAILGENGAGKSTIMSVLFGMYEPDEGEIRIRGQKEKITSPRRASQLNIGMVHQHFKLVSNYTVAENIVLGEEPEGRLLGFLPCVDMKTARRKITELSEHYGLEVDPDQIIEDANVSTRQRVEILKMLYRNAEILIFDEPTAVLTPQEIDALLVILKNLRESGKTVILITHKLEEVKQVADRCAILQRGRLITVRNVADMDTREMASLMVGHEVEMTLEKTPARFGETVVDVQQLSVRNEDDFEVVKNVSFRIRAGEIFAIAGVSGNGQTEIADAIAGLIKTSAGHIVINGRDITGMDVGSRNRSELFAYIPEDRHNVGLVLDFRLDENLALRRYHMEGFSHHHVLNKGAIRRHGEDLIAQYDIRSGEGIDTVVRSMSGGNQQKVIVGREIEREAPFLMFVQPTRGLDIGAIENIHREILKEREKGKAILLISLELDEVMQLADTIGVIYGGSINKIAPASEFTTAEVGEYMMGVGK